MLCRDQDQDAQIVDAFTVLIAIVITVLWIGRIAVVLGCSRTRAVVKWPDQM